MNAMFRRQMLAAALTAAALHAARAQAPKAAPLRNVGVFSLLGDGLQIAYALEATDTRIDRTQRETLQTQEIGLDQAALRAVREAFERLKPDAKLSLYRANTPIPPADQRALADGATRAELPAWIVAAINSAKLSHVLLVTRNRGDAAFPVQEGFTVGSGTVEGIGFYLDKMTEMRNAQTGLTTRGFLGAYIQLRLQLMDTASGDITRTRDVRVGRIYQGRNDAEIANIWDTLSAREKVEVLREMVHGNVARVMPEMLGA